MSVQELVRDGTEIIPRGQILTGFECHVEKFGCYPEGNKEPLNGLVLGWRWGREWQDWICDFKD